MINTFMLDRNYYLKEFVNQVAKINMGRVFSTTPGTPGRSIGIDSMASKRKSIGEVGMAEANHSGAADDPSGLSRFVQAHEGDYERALAEIRSGRKRSHWMWYIFPQVEGLGASPMSRHYAIKSRAEAAAYLRHPILGPRLVACADAALGVAGRSALEIFGSPDDQKLRSCATLFAFVSPERSVFHQLIDRYFKGSFDTRTLQLLESTPTSQ